MGAGSHVTQYVALAEAYLHTKLPLDQSSSLSRIDMGRKLGLLCPPPFLWGEGELGPHLTHGWAEAYLHSEMHLESIQPTVWHNTRHQRHRQTGQDRTDNGPIA